MAQTHHADILYCPRSLRGPLPLLAQIDNVLIEAPAGFGKTTALRHFIQPGLPNDVAWKWVHHSCKKEPAPASWKNFCRALQKVDAKAGRGLLRLGLPERRIYGDVNRLLAEAGCTEPTWLVLEDFHHLKDCMPASMWEVFVRRESYSYRNNWQKNALRVIFVSRPTNDGRIIPHLSERQYVINERNLLLTQEEAGEFFAMSGCPLTDDEASELYRRSGGWMGVVALHLRHYRQHGVFAPASHLEALMREGVWDGLDESAKDLLLRLAPLDSFCGDQVRFALHVEGSVEDVVNALERTRLVHHDRSISQRCLNGALMDYVRHIFAGLPENTRREIFRNIGDWFAGHGDARRAIPFYYLLRDLDKIPALKLKPGDNTRWFPDLPPEVSGDSYVDMLRGIAAHCTDEVKTRHPRFMLQLALEFFGQGRRKDCIRLLKEMDALLPPPGPPDTSLDPEIAASLTKFSDEHGIISRPGMHNDEHSRLRGELLLLEAFSRFNNIREMGERMKRAMHLTGARLSLIDQEFSWTFGNISTLFMFHSKAGRLDDELADMKIHTPTFAAVTRHHCAAGADLMVAESELCRGTPPQSIRYCGKFSVFSGSPPRSHVSIRIGAELVSGRQAILQGNSRAFSEALESIGKLGNISAGRGLAEEYQRDHASGGPHNSILAEADMAASFLMGLLRRPEDMAGWLKSPGLRTGDTFAKRLFAQAVPYAQLCRARYLLLAGKPETLLGEAGDVLGRAAASRFIMGLIYGHIHTAAALSATGGRAEALAALGKALDLALPDRLLLPFAEIYPCIRTLLHALAPEAFPEIKALAKKQKTGRRAVLRELYAEQAPFCSPSRSPFRSPGRLLPASFRKQRSFFIV